MSLLAMQETRGQSLGRVDPLEEGMVTHSSILAWRLPRDREAWQTTAHGVAKSDTTERLILSLLPPHSLFFGPQHLPLLLLRAGGPQRLPGSKGQPEPLVEEAWARLPSCCWILWQGETRPLAAGWSGRWGGRKCTSS